MTCSLMCKILIDLDKNPATVFDNVYLCALDLSIVMSNIEFLYWDKLEFRHTARTGHMACPGHTGSLGIDLGHVVHVQIFSLPIKIR